MISPLAPLRVIVSFMHIYIWCCYNPSCSFTYHTRPSYKISSNSLEQFRSSCSYKVLTCKTLNLDYLPLDSSASNYVPPCTSTYDAKTSYKIIIKSHEHFRRSWAYEVLTCKTFNLDYLPLELMKLTCTLMLNV